MTPGCDLDQAKADFLLFCAVAPPLEVAKSQRWEPTAGGVGNELKLILEDRHPRWHWLMPITPTFPDGAIIDFQAAVSLRSADCPNATHILAQLAGPYREQLARRYAAYMGRVGVDVIEDKQARTQRRNELVNKFREMSSHSS